MVWKFTGDRPVYQQLMALIRGAVLSGEFPPGGKVPSVRELALAAQVNPNTMQRALYELEREGLLVGSGTSGRFVTDDTAILAGLREQALKALARECAEKFSALGVPMSQAAGLLLELEKQKEES